MRRNLYVYPICGRLFYQHLNYCRLVYLCSIHRLDIPGAAWIWTHVAHVCVKLCPNWAIMTASIICEVVHLGWSCSFFTFWAQTVSEFNRAQTNWADQIEHSIIPPTLLHFVNIIVLTFLFHIHVSRTVGAMLTWGRECCPHCLLYFGRDSTAMHPASVCTCCHFWAKYQRNTFVWHSTKSTLVVLGQGKILAQ